MKETTHEMDQDALNANIERSRGDIAVLAASLKKLTEGKGGEPGVRNGEATKGLAFEIKRHPLISGAVALSLGFVIAMLLFRRG